MRLRGEAWTTKAQLPGVAEARARAPVPPGVRLCISQRMMVLRVSDSQDAAYVMWQLNCPHGYAQEAADLLGSTSPHVNIERIWNFQLMLPPLAEQRQIVSRIQSECERIDAVLAQTAPEIALARVVP